VHFSLFLGSKLLFGSQAAQCPKGADSLCLKATFVFIRVMTSLGLPLCQFAISAIRKL
jgi:hypothetical protein